MSYVFYDTETTGLNRQFDQILHFAAIRTDADLRPIDKLDIRARLQDHIVPDPEALHLNGLGIDAIIDPNLPSYLSVMQRVNGTLRAWSPAIFVGYNSIRFDEELLRQALFQTLHPPYLTSLLGNGRGDMLTLAQAASVLEARCLSIPLNEEGRPTYQLGLLAAANGHLGPSHTAMGDVEAMLYLARLIKDRAPDCWNRFVRYSKKASVAALLDEDAVFLGQFYAQSLWGYAVTAVGAHPNQPTLVLCLDLAYDPAAIAQMSDTELRAFIEQRPSPIKRVRTNASPLVAPLDDVPTLSTHYPSPSVLEARGRAITADRMLCERLIRASVSVEPPRTVSMHAEEQIYDHFISSGDETRMTQFHQATPSGRRAIVAALTDSRLQHFGRLLLHAEHPGLLSDQERSEIRAIVQQRWHAPSVHPAPYRSAAQALEILHQLLPAVASNDRERLLRYGAYVARRMA